MGRKKAVELGRRSAKQLRRAKAIQAMVDAKHTGDIHDQQAKLRHIFLHKRGNK